MALTGIFVYFYIKEKVSDLLAFVNMTLTSRTDKPFVLFSFCF